VPVDNPALSRVQGYIGFWIRPNWDGNDGKTHRILRIGDPERNGLLVEKCAKSMLRYVMASPEKVTAARADVSGWKAGEWHHVVIIWTPNESGMPMGLPLWIDKVAADGPIASGNTFLNPDTMDDARIWIGDETADAAMDELIMRARPAPPDEKLRLQILNVYPDYWRSAPYTAIEIDPEPHAVPSDRRVVCGVQKQFGLRGKLNGRWERMTDFVMGFGNWGDFDAKPFITWTTSDETIATVDEDGVVTGHAVGRCTLTAEFRGMKDTYTVRVIPIEQPDLDLYVVERLPRYHQNALKGWPEPGERVKSVAHVANFGFEPTPPKVAVTFELIPDSNRNFRLDPDERPVEQQQAVIDESIAPLEETTVTFAWTWPEEPVWVRVRVDPRNRVSEICEANNEVAELNTAHSMLYGYPEEVPPGNYEKKLINLTGSFSYYDWIRAMHDRLRLMLRESVYPTTSPVGVLDDLRVDEFTTFIPGQSYKGPYAAKRRYHDGGFPYGQTETPYLLKIHATLMHECGHTCLSLPDLYGHPVVVRNVFLRDERGELYTDGPLLPETIWGETIACSAQSVPCRCSYTPLMDSCHMWLHPAHAGQLQYYAGCRGPRFWGVQGRLIPTSRHSILVLDVNDEPLAGAAVYAYHVTHVDSAESSGAKFFADRPKYMGHTDETGQYTFPDKTDEDWDSPETDKVDGAIHAWNPFGTATEDTAFTPTCFGAEGMLLLKIVSGDQTEFHWLTMTMMNEAFFAGAKNQGVYMIRTSLTPSEEPTRLVRRPVPEAIREQNLAPVAKVKEGREITVEPDGMIHLDGSESYDPEGQPLYYRWHVHWPVDRESRFSDKPTYEGKAFDRPCEYEIFFHVVDGVRASKAVRVRVRVVEKEATAGPKPASDRPRGAWWEEFAEWEREQKKAADKEAEKPADESDDESADEPGDEPVDE